MTTSIAGFVSDCATEIEDLFAIDDCKLPSNAAKEWSGTLKELEQKRDKLRRQIHHHLNEHVRLDQQATRDEERQQRIKQTIDTLNDAHDKIDQFLRVITHSSGLNHRLPT